MDEDLVGYIKESLDSLHVKVDLIHEDADRRLKVLEIAKAHDTGYKKAIGSTASFVCALIGGVFSAAITYLSFRK